MTFYLPLKNVSMKNIDVLITRDFLKVNASSIRYICVIDFAHHIDYEHPSTKVTLMDEKLEINVFKPQEEHKIWDFVQVSGLSKDEIRVRREASLSQYYARQEEKRKMAEQVKLSQDKHSIDQQMKIETIQRKQIKAKKEEEKRQAETELFKDLDEMEHRNQMILEQKQGAEKMTNRKAIVEAANEKA